jgi:CHRD domain/PEP-CTERM motif
MSRLLTIVLLAMVVLVGSAQAHEEIFIATMTNAGEPGSVIPTTSTGAPRPASFGTATFVLNDAHTALSMTAVVNNIDITGTQTADTNDNLVAAHIHAGASIIPTAGVVWGFFGAPDNDINPDNLVVTPFAAPQVGGTFTSVWDAPEGNGGTNLAAQLPNIMAQRSYINFHTVQFGGGEVRGTLVPEPSSVALCIACAGLMGVYWRRRRAKTQ